MFVNHCNPYQYEEVEPFFLIKMIETNGSISLSSIPCDPSMYHSNPHLLIKRHTRTICSKLEGKNSTQLTKYIKNVKAHDRIVLKGHSCS